MAIWLPIVLQYGLPILSGIFGGVVGAHIFIKKAGK